MTDRGADTKDSKLEILLAEYQALNDVALATQRQLRDTTIALVTLSVALLPTLVSPAVPGWLYAVIPLVLYIVFLRVAQIYGDVHIQAAHARYLEARVSELHGDGSLLGYQTDFVQPVYLRWRVGDDGDRFNSFLLLVVSYNVVIIVLSWIAFWICAFRAGPTLHIDSRLLFAIYIAPGIPVVWISRSAMSTLDDVLPATETKRDS